MTDNQGVEVRVAVLETKTTKMSEDMDDIKNDVHEMRDDIHEIKPKVINNEKNNRDMKKDLKDMAQHQAEVWNQFKGGTKVMIKVVLPIVVVVGSAMVGLAVWGFQYLLGR